MSGYNGNWKWFEGTRMDQLELARLLKSKEKEHLLEINKMMIEEGYNPEDYYLVEIPINGVYCIDNNRIGKTDFDYFVVEELSGKLTPTYVTKELDENGYNNFPCETIRESSQRNAEYY
ncbi:hypothetical protein ACOJB9_14825 [Carnobacterium maltaromaticum]|uniref:hypothetical protein n=1 Tax=Carnobacterium maltaromaticum TaxID=2751 RepID=UPI003C271308